MMMPIHPLGHHQLFTLLVQLSVLLLVARLFGELCRSLRIPSVVGELTAGVFLGPSLLGAWFPEFQTWLFPRDQLQSDLLSVVTWLGVIFLLLCTGLETDLALIRRQGKKALLISAGGIIVPFFSGILLGYVMPSGFLVAGGNRPVFMLFVATAMSITAIPVIARVLMELKIIRRNIGQMILASGMIDDTIGWALLSIVASLASSGAFDPFVPLRSVVAVGLVLLVALTVGKRFVSFVYRWTDDHMKDADGLLSLTVVLVLLAAATTLKLGLEAVLGAFVFGILLRESPRYRPALTHSLEQVTRLVLAPIFFAAAGLKVNLSAFGQPHVAVWAAIAFAVACFGKFAGVFVGARRAGLGVWESLAVGSGMNARGAMEIIVATIGLSLGVLSTDMYSIVVFIAIATSLMAPPLLRFFLSRVSVDPDEQARLEEEERNRKSFWGSLRRLLLPTRGGGNIRFAASLVSQALADKAVEVTVLNLPETPRRWWWPWHGDGRRVVRDALKVTASALAPLQVRQKTFKTKGRNIPKTIARFAEDHELVVLGASERSDNWAEPFTFNPVVDEVLRRISKPVLVVRAPAGARMAMEEGGAVAAPKRVLVPTTGTNTGRGATEFGLMIAKAYQAPCTLLFVDEILPEAGLAEGYEMHDVDPALASHPIILSEDPLAAALAQSTQVECRTVCASRAGEAIVKVAACGHYDLIVLSAERRSGTQRAYLGPQVDYVLRHATCAVAVLVMQ